MFVYIKHIRAVSNEETGDMNRMRRKTNEKEEEEEDENKRNVITRKRESKNVSP
jgi:hypothetical protein